MAGYQYDKVSPAYQMEGLSKEAESSFHAQCKQTPKDVQLLAHSSAIKGTIEPLAAPSTTFEYTSVGQNDSIGDKNYDSTSLKTTSSSFFSSGVDKFKGGWHRTKKSYTSSLSGQSQDSVKRSTAEVIEPARIGRGAWRDQFLIDRSLRGMAALTTAFAVVMITVVFANLKLFAYRPNKTSTSVGGGTKDCSEVAHTNTVLLLLINVAATMLLGMSNTYQQLITSLEVTDIKSVLRKFGDSRVGTNSPLNINQKSRGKKNAWARWLLLICTSLPIHFLSNSLIGPSYVIEPPKTVQYLETDFNTLQTEYYTGAVPEITSPNSFVCWSALRTGKAHLPKSNTLWNRDNYRNYYNIDSGPATLHTTIVVHYDGFNCSGLVNATNIASIEGSLDSAAEFPYRDQTCSMADHVHCALRGTEPAKCRLNVRMSAAFALMVCLIAKALYMVAINIIARGKRKTQCLTFGDVIVASALDSELRVENECMVNAGEAYRRSTLHTCHKHCTGKEVSKSGDELGHCQKCKKWNTINKFSNLPQPTIATKIKKGLISNLGNTAVSQMIILSFCSMAMVGSSLYVAVSVGMTIKMERKDCLKDMSWDSNCNISDSKYLSQISGGFGGFNQSLTLGSLPGDRIGTEFLSFCISNGAQFIYSLLYLMLIYNITLISQESDWGKLEHTRKRLRCTLVKGHGFTQDYLLQLPKMILFPTMGYSILTHWMIGEALQTQEAVFLDSLSGRHVEHSQYMITFAAFSLWISTTLMLIMTAGCWWAFTYKREGFLPQMFGSYRVLCASTTWLDDFPRSGLQWGHLSKGEKYLHAGLSGEEVSKIVPNELYAGTGEMHTDGTC